MNCTEKGILKCILLNARSIVRKMDCLSALATALIPDIVGITESWCCDNVGDGELMLAGYDMFRVDRSVDAKGGGVLLYVRTTLKAVALETKVKGEHVCCRLGGTTNSELVVCVCYRSGNTILFQDNNKIVRDLLKELQNRNMLLMGDFNYPDIDWSSGQSGSLCSQQFVSGIEDGFLTQHVHGPTRGNACLDLVITKDPDIVEDITVLDTFHNSDHNIILWNTIFEAGAAQADRQTFDYNKADYDAVRAQLRDRDWSRLLVGDADRDWKTFRNAILEVEKKYVPTRKLVDGRKKPIWLDFKAMKAVKKKYKVYAKYKDPHHPAYVRAARIATRLVRESRRKFETMLAQNMKRDSKSFYAYIRGRSKARTRVGPLVNAGVVCTDDLEISEAFNEYFATVFTDEDCASLPNPRQMFTGKEEECLSDIELTLDDVRKKLATLRSDKSGGTDGLNPRFLKEIQTEIDAPLLHIYSESLKSGSVPDDWKSANVCPIFKKGSRSQAGNYRPVSLTSQAGKLLESIIRDSVVDHLESNKLVLESQHGFRRGRSCLSNLLSFLDEVIRSIDGGNAVDVIYLDFAKAFDKVPHRRLVMKLASHGIRGNVLRWIEEWLKGRKQRVCCNGAFSDWRAVTSGVPQGSVLGPVLFLVYINDLDSELLSWVLKFADDTKIFGRVGSDADRDKIQHDLDKLESWSRDWQMAFNVDKCKVMHMGRHNRRQTYQLNNRVLESVDDEKDLGVTVTSDLKSSTQCRNAYNKAIKVLGMINRTIKYKDKGILLSLYKALVRPLLEYATPAWSPHYVKDRVLLERAQHRFTRMVKGLGSLSYERRLESLGIWSLEERRNRADLIEVFKILKGFSTVSMMYLFELHGQSSTRGHTLKLAKHRSSTDLRKYFFSERVINRWNRLDQTCIDSASINVFKSNLTRLRTTQMVSFLD